MPRTVDSTTLRRAFCKLSKALHPDTTALPTEEAASKFQEVCEAYELLNDPLLRDAYDAVLGEKAINVDSWVDQSSSKHGFSRALYIGARKIRKYTKTLEIR